MIDTGYPHADAQSDFQRQRRRQVLSQLAARLRREPDDVSEVLPYDEVVAALGYLGERPLGLQVIPLDAMLVKGSHGLAAAKPEEGALLMTSEKHLLATPEVAATGVFELLLRHLND